MSALRLECGSWYAGAVPGGGNDVDPWVELGDEEDFSLGPQDVGPHVNWRLVRCTEM